jgi:hypothetical protein
MHRACMPDAADGLTPVVRSVERASGVRATKHAAVDPPDPFDAWVFHSTEAENVAFALAFCQMCPHSHVIT